MPTLDDLERRIAKLENKATYSISNQITLVCEVMDLNRDDVWIRKLKGAAYREARERTWFILYLLAYSFETIGVYTGYSTKTVIEGVNAYKGRLANT